MKKSLEEIEKEAREAERKADEEVANMTPEEREELRKVADRFARKVKSSMPDFSKPDQDEL